MSTESASLIRIFGVGLFVGMMAAGYYYNLTFVQIGLEDFGTRILGLSASSVARDMALLALCQEPALAEEPGRQADAAFVRQCAAVHSNMDHPGP